MELKKSSNLMVQNFPVTGLGIFLIKIQEAKTHFWLNYFLILSRITGSISKKDESYSAGIGLS
jgi:hypothetical protein